MVKREAAGDAVLLGSAPVASMPVPNRSRVVAKAYADRRDEVQTPAHTLGDDSLLIKYINPRLLAMATLAEGEGDGGMAGKGQEMTVRVYTYCTWSYSRILSPGSSDGSQGCVVF